jgi:hypothetical protein
MCDTKATKEQKQQFEEETKWALKKLSKMNILKLI